MRERSTARDNNGRHRSSEKFCIVGGGSSGLAAAKNFLDAGIPFDCFEREDDIGGNWYYGAPASRVYASTHTISSKLLTEYSDFPMPEDWPHFPSHQLTLAYLANYARHFGLYDHIQFNTGVEWIEPADDAGAGQIGWRVRLANGQERDYGGVVIANGHNWDPRWPEFPGEFSGRMIHSAEYKTPDVLRGKRVLVVGGGNSGCDIACEAAQHAERAVLSTRRSYHVLPKFFRGVPIDRCNEFLLKLRLPVWARRAVAETVTHFVLGPSWITGMPRPDHRLFESHPILNSQLHHHLGHGRLQIRPDIERLAGEQVQFVDGRTEPFDLIIFATGYRVTVPFIDSAHLNWVDSAPRLFLNVFHPSRDDLFFIGLIQPDSGQFGLVDCQARLVARYLSSLRRERNGAVRWFRQLKSDDALRISGGVNYLGSPRHALEVEHFSYRRKLERLARGFGKSA